MNFANITRVKTFKNKILCMFSCKQGRSSGNNITKKIVWGISFVVTSKNITK